MKRGSNGRMALAAAILALAAPPVMAQDAPGYLAGQPGLDLATILPGPPAPGSPAALADTQRFRDARALQDSARWRQASADVSSDLALRFADALGFPLDWRKLPRTRALFARFDADRSAAIGAAKRHWQSPRPFIGTDLPICEPRTPGLIANGDYPSGHTAHGWGFALLMAELLPDRAQPILARGRDYGDSRWICGSHSVSAVEGGYLAAGAIVAREHGDPAFRRDMAAAARELARYRRALTTSTPH